MKVGYVFLQIYFTTNINLLEIKHEKKTTYFVKVNKIIIFGLVLNIQNKISRSLSFQASFNVNINKFSKNYLSSFHFKVITL